MAAPRSVTGAPDPVPAPAVPDPAAPADLVPGQIDIIEGDNLAVARTLPSGGFTLIYLDPPFNTGRRQHRSIEQAVTTSENRPEQAADGGGSARNRTGTPRVMNARAGQGRVPRHELRAPER
ncbi:MAG: hypothetical protein R2692_02675 [Microbacterium sp.]